MKKVLVLILALALILSSVSFAVAEEKPTLRVAYKGDIQAFIEGEDESHNFIIDYIEEMTGVRCEWVLTPVDDPHSKLNLLVAAQDVDLIFDEDFQAFQTYYNQGMLEPLNDYLSVDNLAPDVWDLTTKLTMGEDMFCVFFNGGQSDVTVVWTYNKPMLDAANITVPEQLTLDQWTDILYAIKAAYPDKIPLAAAGQSPVSSFMLKGMDNVYAAFGLPHQVRVGADGNLEFSAVTQDMRDCIAYINKLYTDGILDPEYLVSTEMTLVPKIINGDVVSVNCEWYEYTGSYSPYMIDENEELTDWVQVPIITGDRLTNGQTNGAETRMIGAIVKGTPHLEEAIKVLSLMSTDEFYYRAVYGTPNVDSVKNEDGSYTMLDTPVGKAFSSNGTLFHNYYTVKESKELRCARLLPAYPSVDRFNCDIMAFYEPKMVDDPVMVHAYIPDYDDNISDFKDIVAMYLSKMVTGEYSLDKFDEMVDELNGIGLEDAMTEMNDWYATTK